MPDRVVSYVFRGSFGSLNAGLATAGKNVTELGAKMTALDKNGAKMRAGLTTFGTAAGKVGLAAGVGLAVVVGVTANFEKAMARVGAATRATGADLENLRAAAIKAGADTIFSASEAADGITELGKAGLSTADILGGGLSGALDLAAAGQIDVAEAASTTAITLQQFGLAGTDATHVADVLAASAGKAMGDVSDMSAALKYVGPVAAQMGISLDQAAGTIAELASQGVIGEQAGTSLRGMLTALTSPSKMAADEMAALGINMYDANGQFVGLDGVAGELADSMSGLSSAERDQALGRIFGNEQITAARILYAGGAGDVQKWTNAVNDTGYAADQAAQLTDNLSGDLEQLKGSLETALIGAGSGSQGPFRRLIQGLTATTNAFVGLPPAAQNTATALLGITAVTGGALWFGSKVINGIVATKESLSQLGITSNTTSGSLGRVARTAGGIVAVAGAVTLLGNALGEATGAKVDSGNLARDLEAAANGSNPELLQRLAEDYKELGQASFGVTEPLKEAATAFGLFGNTALDNSADNIAQVSEQLAALVESGNADQAAAQFNVIAAAITGLPAGSSFNPALLDGFDAYATALDNAAHAAGDAGTAADGAKGPTDAYGVAARQAANASADEAAALNLATEAMQKKTAATLAGFDAETGYRQALKDAQAQAKKNDAGIRGNTDAALANRSALSGLAAAWDNQSSSVKNNVGRYKDARQSFIDTAVAMGVPTAAAKKLADQLLEIPKKTVAKVEADTDQAKSAVSSLGDMLSRLDGQVATTYIRTINQAYDAKRAQPRATGGPIYGPGSKTSDSVPVMASAGEFMMSAAAVDHYGLGTMFAMNARHLAGGGPVDGSARSLDSRLEIAQMLQSIRGMERDLAATIKKGKNKGDHQVTGLDREVLELQLEAAERDLRRAKHADEREAAQAAREKAKQEREARANLYATRGSLFDSLVPQDPQTVSQGVSSAIADFQRQWLDAGGKWSKELREWARNARKAAAEYDRVAAAITAEEKRRDDLTATLDTQKSQYDALTSTMKSFLDSVAANFQSNVFNGATTKTVAGAAGPATAALKEAQAELASLRASNTADSIDAARQAADLIARIKELQTQADAEVADTEVQVSGLDALRAGLASDTANALAFAAALKTLKDKGLDTSGDFGGLYASLAQSGDLATAQQIANLSPEAIDELEKAYKARDDAAIAAGYQATQDVYGQQAALLATAMQQTQAAIDQSTAAIELMNASLPVIADNVRAGTAASADELKPKLSAIHTSTQATADAVKGLARELAELQKTAKP